MLSSGKSSVRCSGSGLVCREETPIENISGGRFGGDSMSGIKFMRFGLLWRSRACFFCADYDISYSVALGFRSINVLPEVIQDEGPPKVCPETLLDISFSVAKLLVC